MPIQIRFRIRIGIKNDPGPHAGPTPSFTLVGKSEFYIKSQHCQLCKVKCVIIFRIFPGKKFTVVYKIFHLRRSRIDTDPDWSDPDQHAL
jgi:hypothetical protein